MTIYICDRCGKEISEEKAFPIHINRRFEESESYVVCVQCFDLVTKTIADLLSKVSLITIGTKEPNLTIETKSEGKDDSK